MLYQSFPWTAKKPPPAFAMEHLLQDLGGATQQLLETFTSQRHLEGVLMVARRRAGDWGTDARKKRQTDRQTDRQLRGVMVTLGQVSFSKVGSATSRAHTFCRASIEPLRWSQDQSSHCGSPVLSIFFAGGAMVRRHFLYDVRCWAVCYRGCLTVIVRQASGAASGDTACLPASPHSIPSFIAIPHGSTSGPIPTIYQCHTARHRATNASRELIRLGTYTRKENRILSEWTSVILPLPTIIFSK